MWVDGQTSKIHVNDTYGYEALGGVFHRIPMMEKVTRHMNTRRILVDHGRRNITSFILINHFY